MSIRVIAQPPILNWKNFQPVDDLGDDNAYTGFVFSLPIVNFLTVGGMITLPNTMITLRPKGCMVVKGSQTPALLKHEQGHYDIGYCVARVLAKDLEKLRESSASDLQSAINAAMSLHEDNAEAIRLSYDNATQHGTDAAAQKSWNIMISKCKGDPSSTSLNGLDL